MQNSSGMASGSYPDMSLQRFLRQLQSIQGTTTTTTTTDTGNTNTGGTTTVDTTAIASAITQAQSEINQLETQVSTISTSISTAQQQSSEAKEKALTAETTANKAQEETKELKKALYGTDDDDDIDALPIVIPIAGIIPTVVAAVSQLSSVQEALAALSALVQQYVNNGGNNNGGVDDGGGDNQDDNNQDDNNNQNNNGGGSMTTFNPQVTLLNSSGEAIDGNSLLARIKVIEQWIGYDDSQGARKILNDLATTLALYNTEHNLLKERVTSNEVAITSLQATDDLFGPRITSTEDKIAEFEEWKVLFLNTRTLDTGDQTMTDYSNYVTLDTFATLSTKVTSAQSNITTLQTDVSTLKSDQTTIKSDVSTLKTTATSLTSRVGELEGETGTLRASLSGLENQTYQQMQTYVDGKIAIVNEDITGAYNNITSLGTAYSTLNSTVQDHGTRLTAVETGASSSSTSGITYSQMTNYVEGRLIYYTTNSDLNDVVIPNIGTRIANVEDNLVAPLTSKVALLETEMTAAETGFDFLDQRLDSIESSTVLRLNFTASVLIPLYQRYFLNPFTIQFNTVGDTYPDITFNIGDTTYIHFKNISVIKNALPIEPTYLDQPLTSDSASRSVSFKKYFQFLFDDASAGFVTSGLSNIFNQYFGLTLSNYKDKIVTNIDASAHLFLDVTTSVSDMKWNPFIAWGSDSVPLIGLGMPAQNIATVRGYDNLISVSTTRHIFSTELDFQASDIPPNNYLWAQMRIIPPGLKVTGTVQGIFTFKSGTKIHGDVSFRLALNKDDYPSWIPTY